MEEGSGSDMEVWDKEEMTGVKFKDIDFLFFKSTLSNILILVHGELTHLLYADDEPNATFPSACSVHISSFEFPKDTSEEDKQTKK